jgi:hypothetical protein
VLFVVSKAGTFSQILGLFLYFIGIKLFYSLKHEKCKRHPERAKKGRGSEGGGGQKGASNRTVPPLVRSAGGRDDRQGPASRTYLIPLLNHPCTLSASLAVRLYCRRFAFAFTNDLEMELEIGKRYKNNSCWRTVYLG